ncbi:MAG: serine/threonine protein kinase [Myxococcales bacterium]|nr:serine/threonine protein kinase [Myxococcales bacterium]
MPSEALQRPSAPQAPPIELERLRSAVKARLFQRAEEPLRIGRFRVLRCVGQGGMGMVFAAHDDVLQRTVALKLLRPELSSASLTDEAHALARLSHPNVVGIYDVGVHDGQHFIAMEFVDGCTLGAWLRGGRALSEVINVFVAAGRGLAAAHAVGLVHRDFKPDNVLVGRDGRPRILDFGLARPPDRRSDTPAAVPPLPAGCAAEETALTQDGVLLGTPAYMAPEQHLGEPADARSDQFSFAVALYEAVYGSRPFRGDDIRTLSLAIVRGALQRPPTPRYDVPPWLDALLERALRVSPDSRFPSMDALVEELATHSAAGTPTRRQTDPQLEYDDTLSLEDVRDVAAQVGLAETEARAALRRDRPRPPAPTPRLLAPAGQFLRMATAVSTTLELPERPSPNTMVLMAHELEIAEGRRGKSQGQFIGESLAWTSPSLELRVMPRARGATVLLVRDLAGPLRRRLRRTIALTSFGAFVLFVAIAESLSSSGGDARFVLLFVFLLVAELALGWSISRELHRQQQTSEQARVDHYAQRLAALAEAERSGPHPGLSAAALASERLP